MSGFDTLKGAIDPAVAQQPILAADVAFADEALSDADALGIVLQDTQESMSYLQSKGLVPLGIDTADDLVRAYVRPRQWPDGKARANLGMHVTLEAIEKILPVLHMSLFGQGKKNPFLLTPLGKTKPEAARAKSTVLAWAMKQAGTKEEIRLSLKTVLTHGFMVGSWGWECKQRREKIYSKQPDGTVKGTLKEVDINIPFYKNLDLKQVLVDPSCKRQSVHSGKFIINQTMVTALDLDDLREDDTYKNVPTREELAAILSNRQEPTEDSMAANKRAVWREFQAELDSKATSKDPLQQPLELLEYWSADRVITVLQRRIVIRNEANEYGRLPFQSCAFIDVLNSAWGFGVCKLLAGEQRLQQGVVNQWIDSLALVLNPTFQLLKGIGPGTQSIPVSPGKVITEAGELKPLVAPDVTRPAMEAISTSDERASRKVGANSGSGMPDQAMRTAEGVQAFAGDVIQRLQYFLEIFIDHVYVPVLEAFLELCADHLTPEQINGILAEAEGKAWEGDILDIYNAKTGVDVLAGTRLTAKFAAAQLAPMIMQLVASGPVQDSLNVQGKKFDYAEYLAQTLELMGLDGENLIVDQTPADMQRVKEQNAAMQKVQGDLTLQGQKHQDTLGEIDAKGAQQAGVAVVRSVLKNHEASALSEMAALQQQPGAPAPTGA